MIRRILIFLMLPVLSFSQGLEGGFIDNVDADQIDRLVLNEGQPELELPVSDIIQFEQSIITFSGGILYTYDLDAEKSNQAIDFAAVDSKFKSYAAQFVQLDNKMLYINFYDNTGSFKTALQCDLVNMTVMQEFSFELVEVFSFESLRYFILEDATSSNAYKFGYSTNGAGIVPYTGFLIRKNYSLNIDNKGFVFLIASPTTKPSLNILCLIDPSNPGVINEIDESTDNTYAYINNQVFYSSTKQIKKIGEETAYNILDLEGAVKEGIIDATNFFTLGTTIFGYYVRGEDGSFNLKIAETKGLPDVEAYEYSNLFIEEENLSFAKTIVSIQQANANHIAVTNSSGTTFETLVINEKGTILNAVPADPIKMITSSPIKSATVFDTYLALHFEKIQENQVTGSLGYLDLTNPGNFTFAQIPKYEDVGYNFNPSYASSRGFNYVVFGSDRNGFELNILSSKTQSGYLVAEEITNGEFEQKVLEGLGVSSVEESFSTYPKNLISYNNTLYYMAHLASGSLNGYYYLYKVNRKPTNINISNNLVSEAINTTTTVATISAADLDDQSFTYSLVSGVGSGDNGLFSIVGNSLRTNGGFNYEVDSTLTIRLGVSDPHGATYQKVIPLKVTNANDAPTAISLSGDKIGENATIGTKIADISTVDEDAGDSFIYTLVDDAAGAFVISGNELLTNQTYDQAIQNTYNIRIRTEDEQLASFEQDFIIGITEVNAVPTDIQLSSTSIAENAPNNQVVGELTTVDADPEDMNFIYELVDGTGSSNNADFVIDNISNPATLSANKTFDFDLTPTLSLRIKTTDPKGANFVKQFQITVTDANDPPTEVVLLADSIAENQPVDSKVGALSTVDPDVGDTFTYALVAGAGDTDNSQFKIDNTTGDLLQAGTGFDFELKNTYNIRVASTDSGGETVEGTLTVNILDDNEAPSSLMLSNTSVNEENASAIVGEITVTDPDNGDTYSLSLPDSVDNDYFQLAAGGILGLSNALNYEDASLPNPLTVVIQATDNGGQFIMKDFSISVLNIDDPVDSIRIFGNPIFSGGVTSNDVLGVISIYDDELINSTDYDRTLYVTNTFDDSGAALDDNTKFNIIYNSSVGSFGQYQIKAFQDISYDAGLNNVYDFTVTVTNGGATVQKQVVFEIRNPSDNLSPTLIQLSDTTINENTEDGRIVGNLSTDDPNNADTYNYAFISGGADNSFFEISGDVLLVKESTILDFSLKNNYEIAISATETNTSEAYSVSRVFRIRIVEYIDVDPPIIDDGGQSNDMVSNGVGSVSLSLAISDWKLSKIEVQKSEILSTTFSAPQEAAYDDIAGTLDISVSETDFDAFGMKLKVIATDEAGNQRTSDTFYVYRSLLDGNIYSELPSENLGIGRLTTDYRMFSIPYDVGSQGVKNLLEKQLGVQLGSETFQVFQYNPSTNSYTNGVSLNNFVQGKSYWFTTLVENPQINFGAGELFPYKSEYGTDSVFVFKLKQGWNQVGNPYPVAIDWSSLIDGTNVGQLQVYDAKGYKVSATLPVHGGGFVLVQEDVDVPAVLNTNSAQREVAPSMFDWKIDITINQNDFINSGAVGMHKEAEIDLDAFDLANPPHFSEYVEIDFNKSERFYSNYNTDIISPQANYVWSFNVNSHQKDAPVTLSWSRTGILPNQVFLIDLSNLMKLDMSEANSYHRNTDSEKGFKIVYSSNGELLNLGELLVGQPIPNPMKGLTTIGLNLPSTPSEYSLTAEIIDLQGKLMKQLMVNKQFTEGYHMLRWDGTNAAGEPVASGLYIYRVKINGEQSGIYTGRILKQN